MKNLFVTGYAAHELGIYDQKNKALLYIRKACIQKMIPLIESGTEWIITCGNYGFDLWGAEVAIQLRDRKYPQLKVSIIQAYKDQEKNWNEEKQNYFNKIKSKVDHFAIVSHQPYVGPWQFQARDQLIFNKTDGMLIFYDEEAASSKVSFIKSKAEKKAEKENYPIITISADDIQTIVEEEMMKQYEKEESFYE